MNKFKVAILTIVLVLIGGVVMFNKDISADENNSESMSQNIINSPCAEAYQAGRDLYVTRKPKERHVTEQYKKQIQKYLPEDKTKVIGVMVRHGSGGEVFQFAKEHVEYLKSLGWQVKGIDTLISTGPEHPQEAKKTSDGSVNFIIGRQE